MKLLANRSKKLVYTIVMVFFAVGIIYMIHKQSDDYLLYTGESFLVDKYCYAHDKNLVIEYDSPTSYDWSRDPFALSIQGTNTGERYIYDLRYLERDFSYISSYCEADGKKHIGGGGGGYFGIRSITNFSNDQYEKSIRFVIDALINHNIRKLHDQEHIADNILFYTPFNRASHIYYGFVWDDRIIGKLTKSDMVGTYLYDYQLYASGSNFLVLDIAFPLVYDDGIVMMEENVFMDKNYLGLD